MELKDLRNEIDKIDQELVCLIEKRMEIVKKIGKYKKEKNLPILDQNREEEVINKNIAYLKNSTNIKSYKEIITKIMEVSKKIEK